MCKNDPSARFFCIVVLALAGLGLFFMPGRGTAGQSDAADPSAAKDTAGTITVFFENDTFFDTDYLYTNGVKLTWISPSRNHWRDFGWIPQWGQTAVNALPLVNADRLKRSVTVSLGQNMYTPSNTYRRDLIHDDRPYAGLIYLSLGLNGKCATRMDTLELDLGIAGPSSLAEETQRMVHEIKGVHVPEGWDNQLKDEPIVNLFVERKWRKRSPDAHKDVGMDLIPNFGAGLGNAVISVHGGIQVRLGWNLPDDFGTNLIRPGSDTNAPAVSDKSRFRHRWGIHAFTGVDARWIIRDITLDGNTFQTSSSVDKEPLVGDFMAGIGLVFSRFKISLGHVIAGRGFRQQESNHEYGSITVSGSY